MTAAITVPDNFGDGGRGLASSGAHGDPTLEQLLTQPASKSYAAVDFGGAAANGETYQVGTEIFTKVAAAPAAFEFTGGTANAQAIDFDRAINADSLFMDSTIDTDTVFTYAKKAGLTGSLVLGNATITNGLANVTAPATMEHAADKVRKEMYSIQHVPNASEIAAGLINIPLPFVPGTWKLRVYVTSTGAEKDAGGTDHANFDGAITVDTSPDRLIIGQGSTLAWAATDTLHIEVTS